MSISIEEALALRAKFFRGLADPSRLALLLALRSGEKTVGMLGEETGLSQSNISNHLACLKDCGLVLNRQEWRHVYYRIANEKIQTLLGLADDVITENARNISECANYCVDANKRGF